MRTRIALAVLLLALLALSPAHAATSRWRSRRSGFTPSSVTVAPDDTVTWTNADTSSHQLESKSANFSRRSCKPGESYSFVFKTPGKFNYGDLVVKRIKGR